MMLGLPSFVSAVSVPVARSVTHRLLPRTNATRRPSGLNLANICSVGSFTRSSTKLGTSPSVGCSVVSTSAGAAWARAIAVTLPVRRSSTW